MFFFLLTRLNTTYVIEAGLNYLQLVINLLNRNAPQEIAILRPFLMIFQIKKKLCYHFLHSKKKILWQFLTKFSLALKLSIGNTYHIFEEFWQILLKNRNLVFRFKPTPSLLTTKLPMTTVAKKNGMQTFEATSIQSHIDSIHSPHNTRKTIMKLCMKSVKFHRGISFHGKRSTLS